MTSFESKEANLNVSYANSLRRRRLRHMLRLHALEKLPVLTLIAREPPTCYPACFTGRPS